MKLSFILCLLGFGNLSAQVSNRIDTIKFFEKNKVYRIHIDSYDLNSNRISRVVKSKENGKFLNVLKLDYKYDRSNRLIEYLFSNWELNKWVNDSKQTFQYTQLNDTLVLDYIWDKDNWYTSQQYDENHPPLFPEQPKYDARSIKTFEEILRTKQRLPDDESIKMEYQYDTDHKVVSWKDGLSSRQKYVNQLIKLNYEYVGVGIMDSERGSLVFKNCKTNHVSTITIWYRYYLSVQLEWFDDSIKPAVVLLRDCK